MNGSTGRIALVAVWIVVVVLGNSCSSTSVPRSNMRSTDVSFRSDLEHLEKYIDTMPADIVVAGYPKDTTGPVTYTVDAERMQTTYRGVVVKRITPEYTVFRPRVDTSRVLIVPTKTVSSISINGVRKKRGSGATPWLWLLLPLGGIALLATWGWRSAEAADASTGYRVPPVNSCLVILAIILLVAATLVIAVSIPLVNALLGEAGTYERVSQTWMFQ